MGNLGKSEIPGIEESGRRKMRQKEKWIRAFMKVG